MVKMCSVYEKMESLVHCSAAVLWLLSFHNFIITAPLGVFIINSYMHTCVSYYGSQGR